MCVYIYIHSYCELEYIRLIFMYVDISDNGSYSETELNKWMSDVVTEEGEGGSETTST